MTVISEMMTHVSGRAIPGVTVLNRDGQNDDAYGYLRISAVRNCDRLNNNFIGQSIYGEPVDIPSARKIEGQWVTQR
jgi:hypothetical protein